MCRRPLDGPGNNCGDDDDSDGQEQHDWGKVRCATGDIAYTMPTMLNRTKRPAVTAVTATDTALMARAGRAPPAGLEVRIVSGCIAPLTPMPTLKTTAVGRWRATPWWVFLLVWP